MSLYGKMEGDEIPTNGYFAKIHHTVRRLKTRFYNDIIIRIPKTMDIAECEVSNLYQAVRADIIGTDLTCLAQVKRVFPYGTELMKNTIVTKIRDVVAKQSLIDAMSDIADGSAFDFEAIAVSSIQDKPVYQLEIIALYQ